ncbi:hypothetical protein TWF217_003801 [Orbilia oligospora]|nr:hypothetical protein TWF217_003801 [Orbilia oligospora]
MASTEIQPGPRSLRRESMKLTQRSQSFDYRIRRRNIFEEVATAKVAAMREAKLPKDSARTLGTSIPRKHESQPHSPQLGPDPNFNNAPGDPQKGTPTKRSRRKW